MLFFTAKAGQENRKFFLCEYQVAALATDTHKQAGSKFPCFAVITTGSRTKFNVVFKWRRHMANDIAGMIKADLAALTNAASDLASQAGTIAPAAQFGTFGNAAAGQSGGFAQAMMNAVSSVNAADKAAGEKMADVDAGRSDDLVGAMLASQEASLSFSMLMQVRNKVMGAVDELIKLPL